MQTSSQKSHLSEPTRSKQKIYQYQAPATQATISGLLPPSANTPSPTLNAGSQRLQGEWQPLTIDTSLANTLQAKTATLSPIHDKTVRSNAPQLYYPGISIPSIPPPKFSSSKSQRKPAKLWVPLGVDVPSYTPRQAEPSMWLPATSPLIGKGVRTTFPGMALAETNNVQPKGPSTTDLSGPWYTLAALGPASFHLTSDRMRILTYIVANTPIPSHHLWAIIAELYLCKKHYTGSTGLDSASSWDCTDCIWDLSPYLRVMYDIDILEGDLDSMYERLARFTNRGSPMWGLKVEPRDKIIWEEMANEAEEGFNRLAPESKKQVLEKWKGFCWDVKRNVVKRPRVEQGVVSKGSMRS